MSGADKSRAPGSKESAGLCGCDGTVPAEKEAEWVPDVQSEGGQCS